MKFEQNFVAALLMRYPYFSVMKSATIFKGNFYRYFMAELAAPGSYVFQLLIQGFSYLSHRVFDDYVFVADHIVATLSSLKQ